MITHASCRCKKTRRRARLPPSCQNPLFGRKNYTFGPYETEHSHKSMDLVMNEKSKRITEMVKYLQTKYGDCNILLKDHWEADKNAIGLTDKTEQYLAYISTAGDDEFYLELENPPVDDNFPYSSAGDFDNINLLKLEELIAKHLKLSAS
jgi:hypothetical protein